MKAFKEVYSDRRKLRGKDRNTVHRSSLMVPEIAGSVAEISFLNHFLLKRGINRVGCLITAFNPSGSRIESRLISIDEPRVYTLRLSGMFQEPVSQYMVEFYSPENLFVPFSAVNLNHSGPGFVNQLHSYNRVLNDIFENDAVNKTHVCEASIDLDIGHDTDTFLVFSSGIARCQGAIQAEVITESRTYTAERKVDVPRFGTAVFKASELFPDFPQGARGVFRVRQPQQPMFYGRLLAGQVKSTGSFSANHSYYDSSSFEEYWEDSDVSSRVYPFFKGLSNKIRMYPIMSPGELAVSIDLHSQDGRVLRQIPLGLLRSPGNRFVDADIHQLAQASGVDASEIGAFKVSVQSSSGKIPTRVNHQLVYGAGGLPSSINVSLLNREHAFLPKGKTGFTWGQALASRLYDSQIGVVADLEPIGKSASPYGFELKLYTEAGELASRRASIHHQGAVVFDLKKDFSRELGELASKDQHTPVWYTVESPEPVLYAFSIWRNTESGHASGEHGF